MKNACIFVASTQLMGEHEQLALLQGGLFLFAAKGLFSPIKRRPAFTERFRNVSLAQATVLTAVFGWPLFLSAYVNTVHNVTHRKGNSQDQEGTKKSATCYQKVAKSTRITAHDNCRAEGRPPAFINTQTLTTSSIPARMLA
jgi:hypothetical protein